MAPVPREELPRILDPSPISASDRVTETSPDSFTAPDYPDVVQVNEAAPEPVVALSVVEPTPKASVKRKPRRPNPVKSVRSKLSMPDDAAQTAAPVDDLDDLAALELDNLHLKNLLVEKLRIENGKLAKMLERFAT